MDWRKFFKDKAEGVQSEPRKDGERISAFDEPLKANRGISDAELVEVGVLQPGEMRNG